MACSRPALVWVFSSSRVEAAAADNLLKEKGIEAREEVRKGEGRRDGRELGGRGGGGGGGGEEGGGGGGGGGILHVSLHGVVPIALA